MRLMLSRHKGLTNLKTALWVKVDFWWVPKVIFLHIFQGKITKKLFFSSYSFRNLMMMPVYMFHSNRNKTFHLRIF